MARVEAWGSAAGRLNLPADADLTRDTVHLA
jgi:hypothetical protein